LQRRAKFSEGNGLTAGNECRKAIELLEATADDPNSADQRRSKVIAYGDLGEAYILIATGIQDGLSKVET
jgi:hypothetical protein